MYFKENGVWLISKSHLYFQQIIQLSQYGNSTQSFHFKVAWFVLFANSKQNSASLKHVYISFLKPQVQLQKYKY